MPRPVVPSFASPFARSRAWSIATWCGRMSGHASEMRSCRAASTPALLSSFSSCINASGETTTPLPMKHSRRDEAQDGLAPLDDQRVAGVVPALEADHRRHVVGQPVDDLALALVTPLGADDDYVARHLPSFFSSLRSHFNSAASCP